MKFPITYSSIRHACNRKGLGCDLRLCRKVHGSWLHQHGGITAEEIDFLQGRTSSSIFSRHYLTPDNSLKDRVLETLDRLSQEIPQISKYSE